MNDHEKHQHCTTRFIDLANKLKDEGFGIELISASLMSASGVYATYVGAGNAGALEPSGIEKVAGQYRHILESIQNSKKAQLTEQARTGPESVGEDH